ncbi:MAG TPA: MmcB family DNA repair protein [Stellaceae bacterium]|nr:MmcB family DNA repair protein [Stellaceae bacterium]
MDAKDICRGTARALARLGFASLAEVPLANGRRADLFAVARDGLLLIVEVKSSLADFRADRKWQEYRLFCDRLAFAVAADFPRELIPDECGLIVADPFDAALLREGALVPLAAARRKALMLRFGRIAASRLLRLADPAALDPEG